MIFAFLRFHVPLQLILVIVGYRFHIELLLLRSLLEKPRLHKVLRRLLLNKADGFDFVGDFAFELDEEVLSVSTDLGGAASADLLFDLHPLLAVPFNPCTPSSSTHTFNEAAVFRPGPPALVQSRLSVGVQLRPCQQLEIALESFLLH